MRRIVMKLLKWYKNISKYERAAILGGLFALLAALVIISPNFAPIIDDDLRIVDTKISEKYIAVYDTESKERWKELYEIPKLEFKLRNKGRKIALIKEARIKVCNILELIKLPLETASKYMDVSWTYQFELPLDNAPYSKLLPISQEIEPNKTDRFAISLGHKKILSDSVYFFNANVELVYNESNKKIETEHLIFQIPVGRFMFYLSPEYQQAKEKIAEKGNFEALRQIREWKGQRSASVLNLVSIFEKKEQEKFVKLSSHEKN